MPETNRELFIGKPACSLQARPDTKSKTIAVADYGWRYDVIAEHDSGRSKWLYLSDKYGRRYGWVYESRVTSSPPYKKDLHVKDVNPVCLYNSKGKKNGSKLMPGETVKGVVPSENGMVKIIYRDKFHYIKDNDVSDKPELIKLRDGFSSGEGSEITIFRSKNLKGVVTKILPGSGLEVLKDKGEKLYIKTFGYCGWVDNNNTSPKQGELKLFFIDVGQGDSCLIETPDGRRLLIDAGKQENTYRYLRHWKYSWQYNNKRSSVHLDGVFLSHFDNDHYVGLKYLLDDEKFTIGTVYHQGLARYASGVKPDNPFNSLDDLAVRLDKLKPEFREFISASLDAREEGRLNDFRLLTSLDETVPGFDDPDNVRINVLGPIAKKKGTTIKLKKYSSNEGTILNGNSLVLKVVYGARSTLLAGDLNLKAQEHFVQHYCKGEQNPLCAAVTKSYHHGDGKIHIPFIKKVEAIATIVSSGDNEDYSHPRANALGLAGKHSIGEPPLVFSTEIARSQTSSSDIHYGLINLRCNRNRIVIAQMKEKKDITDPWDSNKI